MMAAGVARMGNHNHDHDHGHRPGAEHGGHGHEQERAGGGSDTRFLDLELSKVLFDQAESITREAFRELLAEAAKQHLRERWGERIHALAVLAVDELIADAEANLEIEAQIAARTQAREGLDARVAAILGRPTREDADAEGTGEPSA
jgi:hypothetical protein